MKPIEKDGKFYRMRRGKLVEIPPEWVGKTPDQRNINKRPSEQIHKLRKDTKLNTYNVRYKRKKDKLEILEMKEEVKNDK